MCKPEYEKCYSYSYFFNYIIDLIILVYEHNIV